VAMPRKTAASTAERIVCSSMEKCLKCQTEF
jgi:hypothetical protein